MALLLKAIVFNLITQEYPADLLILQQKVMAVIINPVRSIVILKASLLIQGKRIWWFLLVIRFDWGGVTFFCVENCNRMKTCVGSYNPVSVISCLWKLWPRYVLNNWKDIPLNYTMGATSFKFQSTNWRPNHAIWKRLQRYVKNVHRALYFLFYGYWLWNIHFVAFHLTRKNWR